MNYKLLNDSVVSKIDDDGVSRKSASVMDPEYLEWLAAGNTPAPADPTPNPRIAEIKARLAQIDIESIRALRAKSVGKGKPADDTKLSTLDTEADNLRAELAIAPEFA